MYSRTKSVGKNAASSSKAKLVKTPASERRHPDGRDYNRVVVRQTLPEKKNPFFCLLRSDLVGQVDEQMYYKPLSREARTQGRQMPYQQPDGSPIFMRFQCKVERDVPDDKLQSHIRALNEFDTRYADKKEAQEQIARFFSYRLTKFDPVGPNEHVDTDEEQAVLKQKKMRLRKNGYETTEGSEMEDVSLLPEPSQEELDRVRRTTQHDSGDDFDQDPAEGDLKEPADMIEATENLLCSRVTEKQRSQLKQQVNHIL